MQLTEREMKRKNFASATEPLPCAEEENYYSFAVLRPCANYSALKLHKQN
jgi:hypothetical protein